MIVGNQSLGKLQKFMAIVRLLHLESTYAGK